MIGNRFLVARVAFKEVFALGAGTIHSQSADDGSVGLMQVLGQHPPVAQAGVFIRERLGGSYGSG